MKAITQLIALLFFFFTGPASALTVSPADGANYYNEGVTVKGIVTEVHTSNRGNIFLNFGGKYPNQIFTGFIPAAKAASFPNVNSLEGQEVCIDGVVVPFKGKPEIKLERSSQLNHPCR